MITDDIKLIKKFSEKLFHFYDERDEIEDYNVKIIIGQDYNKKTFKAHLYLIRAMCPYFNTAFKKDWRKKDNDGFFFIEKPNIKPEVFEVILRYIYSGSISCEKKSPEFLFEIMFASDELILHDLYSYIEKYLIEHHSTYLNENFPYILSLSFEHPLWKRLQEFCLTKINNNPYSIFELRNFQSISSNFFKEIIKNDKLLMDEIDIWKSLIIWFKPFKEFIQQDIYESSLWYYVNPSIVTKRLDDRKIKFIDSNLLKLKHLTLICSWIDKKSEIYNQNNLPYTFDLKIRGTLDGFTANIFQKKSRKLENTIIIMRVKGTNELIGGYNPYIYEHDRWKEPNEFWRTEYKSFIFSFPDETSSLDSKNNISWLNCNNLNFSTELKKLESRSILSRIDPNHISNAFYISKNTGPRFGKYDLFLEDNFNLPLSCRCSKQYYLNDIRDEFYFCIDEYELFKIIKK
ncbi:unnamed protein product [Rhizophagus irregularis]|nr:unnamed protein product [Rhizophagus irregularis]